MQLFRFFVRTPTGNSRLVVVSFGRLPRQRRVFAIRGPPDEGESPRGGSHPKIERNDSEGRTRFAKKLFGGEKKIRVK